MDNKITVISHQNSCFNSFLYEMRAVGVQDDRMRFRANIQRCSYVLAYEMSRHFSYTSEEVITPLGSLMMDLPDAKPVIISILRAGVPMHNGFLEFFDDADNGFISAYRHHTKGNEFIVKVEYAALPPVKGRRVILVDPMIATGKSVVLSYQAIRNEFGKPGEIYIGGIIASEEGLEYVQRHIPEARIFVGAVDKELTAKAYIVPGLGDAGDLAYGSKQSG